MLPLVNGCTTSILYNSGSAGVLVVDCKLAEMLDNKFVEAKDIFLNSDHS